MKSTISSIALVASFLSAVSAAPFEKRDADIQWDIVTDIQVETAWATVYATEGAPAPTTTSSSTPVYFAETTTAAAGFKGHRSHSWQWQVPGTFVTSAAAVTTAYVAPPPPPAPETTSSTSTSTSEAPVVTYVPPTTTAPAYTPPAAPTTIWTPPTIIPTTTAATTQAAQTPSAYTGDASYEGANLEIAIVNSTNTYRTMFQAAPVTWNQSLVDMAANDASKCDWAHTNAGQNLAAGYGGPQGAVGGWGDEYKTFNFAAPDFSESCGHFTQLVWQDTTTVGCAAYNCPTDGSTSASGWFLICNYFPVGNMLGEFPENVKTMAPGY